MTYSAAIEYLYGLRLFGTKLGLTHTLELAALAGNPHQKLRFIHVAGTNGKGSTCAMLESVYRRSGIKVGLFTSPHLVAFGERIQVNRRPIPEPEVVRLVEELRPLLGQFAADSHPTFFEVVTIMALRYFEEQKCDLVVWETGLGGRLDATNIVTPLVSLITNIHYDHQKWLGQTLAEIASEKAGIIKAGIPVITAADQPEAIAVIQAKAFQENAPFRRITPADAVAPPLKDIPIALAGAHQRVNAALALAAVHVLQPVLPVSEQELREGLSSVYWPGRMQVINRPSGQRIVLDGAHNVGGIESLAQELPRSFPQERITLVLGILEDKDSAGMCQRLAQLADRVVLVPVHNDRSANPATLAEAFRSANASLRIEQCADLGAALSAVESEPLIVICGSLYLVGEAMERLSLSTAPAANERALNNWGIPSASAQNQRPN